MNLVSVKNKRNIFLIILIIIGIIAILVSIYILNLKPYVAELEKRDRDPARIEDLSLIDSALTKLRDANPNIFWGDQNRVYVSLPSYSANCSGLELPSLPEGFEYRCKTEAEYLKIDGQGWLPVDFTKLPKDFKFEKSLPKDPVKTDDSRYYYSYTIGEKNDFVITSLLESDEYLKKTALNDGGTDPMRLEVGSNLQLWAKVSGLVGYWNFDEGEGKIAKDLSGNGNDGNLISGPVWIDGKVGKALSFYGVDDYVEIPNSISLNPINELTISFLVNLNSYKGTTNDWISIIGKNIFDNGYMLWFDSGTGNLRGLIYTEGVRYDVDSEYFIPLTSWTHIIYRAEQGELSIFVNGELKNTTSIPVGPFNTNTNSLQMSGQGTYNFNGVIDEFRIYNRALNEKEIQKIYSIESL